MRNLFVQSESINEDCDKGGNIGIRHVYFRMQQTRKNSGIYIPEIEVSFTKWASKEVFIRHFPLATFGWPNALHEAVKCSFEESVIKVAPEPKQRRNHGLSDALSWVNRNESELASKLWGMFGHQQGTVLINSEFIRNSKPMYMVLRVNPSGSLVISSRLPHTVKTLTIKDYSMLFETAAYYTALQIIHREFVNEESYQSYAAGVYFLLKGEWFKLLEQHSIEYQSVIDDKGYDIVRWYELINQWYSEACGTALLV